MMNNKILLILKRSVESTIKIKQCHQYQRSFCTKKKLPTTVLTSETQIIVSPNNNPYNVENNLQINWRTEIDELIKEEKNTSILAPVADQSKINVEPTIQPTFNFAAYVSKSETLQQFVKLGVNLSKIERRKGIPQFVLNLDFERDMQDHLLFLTKDLHLNPDILGWFLTKNPLIFKETLDNLRTRINYLESKRFSKNDIVSIIERNPFWLMFSTKRIDRRLGFFQREFHLSGNDVRTLTLASPKLITYNLTAVREVTFSVKEEMCLDVNETKQLLLQEPKIWLTSRPKVMAIYDYLTREMKIDNSMLLKQTKIFKTRLFKIKQRHGFLASLGKAQYDPTKDLYVALDNLAVATDAEFVENIAKVPYAQFDAYLRTL